MTVTYETAYILKGFKVFSEGCRRGLTTAMQFVHYLVLVH
jgi:hypothetical protein